MLTALLISSIMCLVTLVILVGMVVSLKVSISNDMDNLERMVKQRITAFLEVFRKSKEH